MKHEITSTTMNSSTALLVPAFKTASHLGWSVMPAFPVAQVEPEVILGWDAMPAFGHSAPTPSNAELVVELVRETRSANSNAGLLNSFWNAGSLRA